MKLVSTEREKCVQCLACTEVCPMRVIGLAADGFPESTGDAYRLCINCGYCVDICSFDALRHRIRKRTTDSAAALIRYEASQKARLRNLTK